MIRARCTTGSGSLLPFSQASNVERSSGDRTIRSAILIGIDLTEPLLIHKEIDDALH